MAAYIKAKRGPTDEVIIEPLDALAPIDK